MSQEMTKCLTPLEAWSKQFFFLLAFYYHLLWFSNQADVGVIQAGKQISVFKPTLSLLSPQEYLLIYLLVLVK